MNTLLRLPLLLALGALSVTRLGAALESVKYDPENVAPRFPLPLEVDGITLGHAIISISVNAEGRLTDWLVLGYTHELLAKSCVKALQEWRFIPARLDGVPVPAQVTLTFDFFREGAVITSGITEHFLYGGLDELAGQGRYAYRLRSSRELDHAPVRVSSTAPKYALAAARDGVSGRVQVSFYIDEQGAVRMPAVEASAHPYLAEQAVTALRGWKFEPPTSHGRRVLIAASQEFDFNGSK